MLHSGQVAQGSTGCVDLGVLVLLCVCGYVWQGESSKTVEQGQSV